MWTTPPIGHGTRHSNMRTTVSYWIEVAPQGTALEHKDYYSVLCGKAKHAEARIRQCMRRCRGNGRRSGRLLDGMFSSVRDWSGTWLSRSRHSATVLEHTGRSGSFYSKRNVIAFAIRVPNTPIWRSAYFLIPPVPRTFRKPCTLTSPTRQTWHFL